MENRWRSTHRFRALFLTNSNDTTSTRKVRLTKLDNWGREYQFDQEATLAQLNERYTNVKATSAGNLPSKKIAQGWYPDTRDISCTMRGSIVRARRVHLRLSAKGVTGDYGGAPIRLGCRRQRVRTCLRLCR